MMALNSGGPYHVRHNLAGGERGRIVARSPKASAGRSVAFAQQRATPVSVIFR